MSVIKTFFGLILIILFVGFSYWMYATYTSRAGDDAIWDGLNGMMPQTLRQWSCSEIKQRGDGEAAPKSCAAYWDVPGREEAAAPGVESGDDDTALPDGPLIETAPANAGAAD